MGSGLLRHILRGTVGSAGLQLAGTALALFTSVILARALGPAGYGAFAFAIALIYLLAIPSALGLDQLLIREVARYVEGRRLAALKGLLRRSDQLALGVSLIIASIAGVVAYLMSEIKGTSPMLSAVWMGLPVIPMLALTRLRQSALQGLDRVVRGQVPETVAWPILFLMLIAAYLLLLQHRLTAATALVLQVLACAGGLLLATVLLRRHLPVAVRGVHAEYRTREWLGSAFPLVLVAGLQVVNARTDTMMLAALKGAEAVGIYGVASRGAGFVGFFLMAGQRSLAPTIASLHKRGDTADLQRIVTTTARWILVVSTPIALVFILGGRWILAFVYGPAFSPGHLPLALLSIGYLGGVATGPVAFLLVMTGNEQDAARGVALGATLNIVLNAALIPPFGLAGAAVATGLSVIASNAAFVYFVRMRLSIRPTAFARHTPKSEPVQ